MDGLTRQDEYVKMLEDREFDFSLIIAEAFVDSMKSIGYKHTGTALAEDIDNAIEGNAENVYVNFGYTAGSNKPSRLAVIDDGHGMNPVMIRAAVLWGGGTRRDRKLFGRFGFGLPSSSVSIGDRFEVYSRVPGGKWHMVAIDLEEIRDGTSYTQNGRPCAPPAKEVMLPAWVSEAIEERTGAADLAHGTIVLIDKITNLSWKTKDTLERELLAFFGMTYRNFLDRVNIFVNDRQVQLVDPLFLNPDGRFFDENELRAEALEPTIIEVKDRVTGTVEVIKVRYSYLPPGFQSLDAVEGKNNARFNIMKECRGIIVMRAGRQIDVISSRCPWTTFVNYDYNWKIEVDFPPCLDEDFSVTTSKQQIVLSERMWGLLKEQGVYRALRKLRSKVEKAYDEKQQEEGDPKSGAPRPSENIMKAAKKYKPRQPEPSPEQQEERRKLLEREIQRRAKESGKPAEVVADEIEAEVQGDPYKVEFENVPEGTFYRPEPISSQVKIVLNKEHPFYTDLYMGPGTTPRLRTALEILLFVMGEAELDSPTVQQLFYRGERREWTERLNAALTLLQQADPKSDRETAQAEQVDVTPSPVAEEVEEPVA